jgi:hypothetical protein
MASQGRSVLSNSHDVAIQDKHLQRVDHNITPAVAHNSDSLGRNKSAANTLCQGTHKSSCLPRHSQFKLASMQCTSMHGLSSCNVNQWQKQAAVGCSIHTTAVTVQQAAPGTRTLQAY